MRSIGLTSCLAVTLLILGHTPVSAQSAGDAVARVLGEARERELLDELWIVRHYAMFDEDGEQIGVVAAWAEETEGEGLAFRTRVSVGAEQAFMDMSHRYDASGRLRAVQVDGRRGAIRGGIRAEVSGDQFDVVMLLEDQEVPYTEEWSPDLVPYEVAVFHLPRLASLLPHSLTFREFDTTQGKLGGEAILEWDGADTVTIQGDQTDATVHLAEGLVNSVHLGDGDLESIGEAEYWDYLTRFGLER
jgi:hypothetical protein